MRKVLFILIVRFAIPVVGFGHPPGPQVKYLGLEAYCSQCTGAKKVFLGRIIRLTNLRKPKHYLGNEFDIEFRVIKTFRGRTARIERFHARTDGMLFYMLPSIGDEVIFCKDKWSDPLTDDPAGRGVSREKTLALIAASELHDSRRIEGILQREFLSYYTNSKGEETVFNRYGGEPGATIEAVGPGGKKYHAVTDKEGYYKFADLPYGTYKVYPLVEKQIKWEPSHGGGLFEKRKVDLSQDWNCGAEQVDFVIVGS